MFLPALSLLGMLGASNSFAVTASTETSSSSTMAERYVLTVTASTETGSDSTLTFASPVIVTSTVQGKYKPEHDSALADLGATTGFSAEHASALRDLQEAGV